MLSAQSTLPTDGNTDISLWMRTVHTSRPILIPSLKCGSSRQLPRDCLLRHRFGRICELQAESIVRTFPEMRIASIRPHACLVTKPAPGVVDPDAAKFGRVLDYYDEYNINDCWAWSVRRFPSRCTFIKHLLTLRVCSTWTQSHARVY